MIVKILKYIVVVLITILGLLSILFTAPFSKTTIDIDLGTVIIGTVFLIYALFTLYIGSVLMLISSFWHFPRKVIWFLGITSLVYFVLVLNNLIIFAGGGANALPVFIPLVFYVIASFRFFRRLAKGRMGKK
jgi:hypothetical protein